jgi:hypothetical protein
VGHRAPLVREGELRNDKFKPNMVDSFRFGCDYTENDYLTVNFVIRQKGKEERIPIR